MKNEKRHLGLSCHCAECEDTRQDARRFCVLLEIWGRGSDICINGTDPDEIRAQIDKASGEAENFP